MSMKGHKHTEATRQRMAETHRRRGCREMLASIERDFLALQQLGSANSREYADACGIDIQVAKNRLRRLADAGLATRFPEGHPGSEGRTFTAKEAKA